MLLYQFHLATREMLGETLLVDQYRGVLRHVLQRVKPDRPVGRSIAQSQAYPQGANVDIVSGTPIIDIKPCVPAFDVPDGRITVRKAVALRGALTVECAKETANIACGAR
jgi:hypothetical protein